MKILQIAPLWERVPPQGYGGIEAVVSALTDALVRAGHDVTLWASGDSLTLAELRSVYPRGLRTAENVKDGTLYDWVMQPQRSVAPRSSISSTTTLGSLSWRSPAW